MFELAKEFGLTSKEMEARVRKMGFNIKNYMSTLEDFEVAEVRKLMREAAQDALSVGRDESPSKTVVKRKRPVVKLKKKIVLKKKVEEVKPEEQPEKVAEEGTKEMPPKPEELKQELKKEAVVKEKPTKEKEEVVKEKPVKEKKISEKFEAKIIDRVVLKKETPPAPEKTGKEEKRPELIVKVEKPSPVKKTTPEEKVAEKAVAKETLAKPVEKKPIEKDIVSKEKQKPKEKPQIQEKVSKKPIKRPETKSFIKVIDRRPIEEIRPSAVKAPQKVEEKVSTPPKAPHRPEKVEVPSVQAGEIDSKETQRKGKKKGKRVVKISELEGLVRKKKAKKQKGKDKLKPINKLLSEEVIEPLEEMEQAEAFIEAPKEKSAKAKDKDKEKEKEPEKKAPSTAPPKASKRRFAIFETIQVDELAKRMGVKVSDVIMKLMSLGVMATANQSIDYDVAAIVASEYGFEVEKKAVAEDLVQLSEEDEDEANLEPRPPVVTVMGHVDHGKTTLLDAIRHAHVASKEAGGITQHIGAYQVTLPSGNTVVFLDTPGHEAFTNMRARGAQVTDIVVLVVAADDGVMAQTREAIDHAKAAGVPIIVAVNKIDKPEANPDRVKTELSELGLVPEEWGGDTIFVEVSAKKKIGIEDFLELLALQAEVMELKANPNRPARGHVIEARLDRGRGPVATLLVSKGTLHKGDAIVCGLHYGKVRAMTNDKGQRIDEAGPSTPVEVQGLSGVPEPGAEFVVLPDEKKVREVAEYRQRKQREAELVKSQKMSLETMFQRLQEQDVKELNIVLKTDVQGSLEAMSDALRKLSTPDVKINLVRTGIGAISESDVLLASASDAIIVGFNVRPNAQAKALAEQEKVDIRFYDVIYHAIEEIKQAMVGLLEPEYEEEIIGHAEVRQTFRVPKVGTIAGCYVLDGSIKRGAKARLLRENVVVYTGKIASLRRFKDDVKEVASGYECGIGLENFNDIKVGDVIETFEMKEITPTLSRNETE